MSSSGRNDRPARGAMNGRPFVAGNVRFFNRWPERARPRALLRIPAEFGRHPGLPSVSGTTGCAVTAPPPARQRAETGIEFKVRARWGAPVHTRDRANSVATAPADRTFVLPDAPLVRVGFRPGMVSVGPKDLNRGENPREGRPRGEIAVLSPSALAIPISTIVRVVLRSSTRPPWAVPYVRAVDRFGIRSPHRHPYRFPPWLPR